MIFHRSLQNPAGRSRSLASVRTIVVATLAAYPVGGLLQVLGPDTLGTQLTGLLLILASFAGLAVLAGTRVARVTGEVADLLDEYERDLRARAMETSYQLFASLVLVGIIYLALASDFGWWLPAGYGQWNAVFWLVFLCASVVPTAVLAFTLPSDEDSER